MGMLLRLAALGGNVPTPIHVASANGLGATSCTMTIPASTVSGDLLIAYSISRTTSSTLDITDNDTGTPAWTLVETGTTNAGGTVKLWTNTASSTSASKTITISNASDSCVAGLLVLRNATTATVLSDTSLSLVKSVTGVTVASNALFVLAVSTRTTGSFSAQTTASLGSLTERVDQQSASGSGTALTFATAQITGATGTVSWTCSASAASNAMLVQIT